MLQLSKNQAVIDLSMEKAEIRQMELDWLTTNYDTMAVQAAMFAGFAFEQITQPVTEGTQVWMEVSYIVLTCLVLGFELCVCMTCTFCVIFGTGLALRGPHGAQSIHTATDNMEKEQKFVFTQFLIGILGYLLSNVLKMWIYFRPRIAITVSVPLLLFFLAIVYYVLLLMNVLLLDPRKQLSGRFGAWLNYDKMPDLDVVDYMDHSSRQTVATTGQRVLGHVDSERSDSQSKPESMEPSSRQLLLQSAHSTEHRPCLW